MKIIFACILLRAHKPKNYVNEFYIDFMNKWSSMLARFSKPKFGSLLFETPLKHLFSHFLKKDILEEAIQSQPKWSKNKKEFRKKAAKLLESIS